MNSKNDLKGKAARIKALRDRKATEVVPHERDHVHEMHFLIGKEINAARERLNISKSEFAKRLDIDLGQLSRWLSGRTNLTINSIARMHVALGEPVVSVAGHGYKSFEERGLEGTPFCWDERKSDDGLHIFQNTNTYSSQVVKFCKAEPVKVTQQRSLNLNSDSNYNLEPEVG